MYDNKVHGKKKSKQQTKQTNTNKQTRTTTKQITISKSVMTSRNFSHFSVVVFDEVTRSEKLSFSI